LNIVFVAVEATYGIIAGSTALLADAAHNLSDVLGLLLAWGAARLAKRLPSDAYTYGLGKTTVFAALLNASFLLIAVGGVSVEAVRRLGSTQPIHAETVLWVAGVGVLINAISAAMFARAAKSDINVRGAFIHLLSDAAISVGVVCVGLVLIWRPGWLWLDPAVSLVISSLIVVGAVRLLRAAFHLNFDGVPEHVDLDRVKAFLLAAPGVTAIHDLHVWPLSTSQVALTAHVVVEGDAGRNLAPLLANQLRHEFGIHHSTIQVDDPASVVDCQVC
jgi:cobalt-zinc-cadmium efflux system protein